MEFRLGELFSGPGGLAFGAQLAKVVKGSESYSVKHVWANDIDEDACKTYRRNIEIDDPNMVICAPVQEVDLENLPAIDAFAYGFPCNDFSVVGEHNGMNGSYGGLFSFGVKAMNSHKPLWFFAENVGGLQSANDGRAFKVILDALRTVGPGYILTPHLYKFEEYGIPQTRHRIIIIGIRKDLGLEFKVPAPTTLKPDQRRTAQQAIEEPPIPLNAENNEQTAQNPRVVERLKHIPPGKNAWYEGVPDHLKLNVKGARLSQIYRRLDPNAPAYTITGSGGGGTHVYHWRENRALTNRERARLQTFPDEYVFMGKKESVRKQIGMAVPPEGAKIIVEAVLKTFAGVEYESISSKWQSVFEEAVKPNQLYLGF